MNQYMSTFYIFIGFLFLVAFFAVRGVFALAMANSDYDGLSKFMAWVFCSPLLALGIYFLLIPIPP